MIALAIILQVAEGVGLAKLGAGLGAGLVAIWGVSALVGAISGDDQYIEGVPMPQRTPLDDNATTLQYDVSGGDPSVYVASEMPRMNSTDVAYNGDSKAGIIRDLIPFQASGGGVFVQDDTSSFNRQSMKDYRKTQSNSRF